MYNRDTPNGRKPGVRRNRIINNEHTKWKIIIIKQDNRGKKKADIKDEENLRIVCSLVWCRKRWWQSARLGWVLGMTTNVFQTSANYEMKIRIPLCRNSQIFYENVGICCDTGNTARDVSFNNESQKRNVLLIKLIDFLCWGWSVQQFCRIFLLCRKDHTLLRKNAKASSGVTNGFKGILHLIESPCRGLLIGKITKKTSNNGKNVPSGENIVVRVS